MSLRFDGVGDYARYQGAAGLGNTTSGTLLGWFRKEDSTNDRDILALSRPSHSVVLRIASATQIKGGYSSNLAGFGTYNVSNNTWVGLAVTFTDSNLGVYAYGGGVLTQVMTESWGYSSSNLANIYFGDQPSWSEAALGCWRYGRFWSRILSAAEIEAEFGMTPSSGTPAASTTGLRGSWPMANATDTTDWSGIGNTLTISGAATSAEEPTIGSGASIALADIRQSPARPLGLGSFGVKVI